MRFFRILLPCSLLIANSVTGFGLSHARHSSSSHHHLTGRKAAKTHRVLGQRSIDDERATEIQNALIKQGYLAGEASGHWDSETESAMQKLQSDNGWQTKLVPDSRAIIKLGLGPNHENDLASNGDSEMSTR